MCIRYQESDRAWKVGYEVQFLSELEKIVRSLDRRITHGKERLRRSAEAKQKVLSASGILCLVVLPLTNASKWLASLRMLEVRS